jgi:hypothetical protein
VGERQEKKKDHDKINTVISTVLNTVISTVISRKPDFDSVKLLVCIAVLLMSNYSSLYKPFSTFEDFNPAVIKPH